MTERPEGWVPQSAQEAQAYIDDGGDDPALLERSQWEIDRVARPPRRRGGLGPTRRSPFPPPPDARKESQPD